MQQIGLPNTFLTTSPVASESQSPESSASQGPIKNKQDLFSASQLDPFSLCLPDQSLNNASRPIHSKCTISIFSLPLNCTYSQQGEKYLFSFLSIKHSWGIYMFHSQPQKYELM